jgi:hypothetical protein
MGIYKFYHESSNLGKTIIVIGGVAAGAIAWFAILNPLRKAIISKLDSAKQTKSINNFKDEVKNLEKDGVKQTFTDAQYKGWADDIESQFDGCDPSIPVPIFPGADLSYSGKKVYDIISQFKNDIDFAKLVTAFGVRTYDACGWFTGNVENVTLYGAVSDELTNDEIAILNDKLAEKKITYRF